MFDWMRAKVYIDGLGVVYEDEVKQLLAAREEESLSPYECRCKLYAHPDCPVHG